MDPRLKGFLKVNGAGGADDPLLHELKTTLLADRSNDRRRTFYAQIADTPERIADLVEWETLFPLTRCYPTLTELRTLKDVLVNQLFEDWEFVNKAVNRHEDAIRKRWTKKTVEQKRQLLLRVEPDMPKEHRPDSKLVESNTEAIRKENPYVVIQIFNSTTCLVPHINQEDLTRPKPLLVFLNSRGRHSPSAFAHAELLQSDYGGWSDVDGFKRLEEYTMDFLSGDDRNSYGKIRKWGDISYALELVYKGRAFHPFVGVKILLMQTATWRFLRGCCVEVLHDIPIDLIVGGDVEIQRNEGKVEWETAAVWSTANASIQAPYCVPAQFEHSRLRSLISAQIVAIEDHIWTLREDPSYFTETFDVFYEHRLEMIPGKNGERNSALGRAPSFLHSFIIRDIVFDAYFELYLWHECERQLFALEKLQNDYKDAILHAEDLPEEYLQALKTFWRHLHSILTDSHQVFKRDTTSSPLLREFVYSEGDAGSGTAVRFLSEETDRTETTRLFFKHTLAIISKENPPVSGFFRELDELESLLQSDAAAKSMVTPLNANHLSSMSVASVCIHQLRLYQPWAARIEADIEPRLYDTSWSVNQAYKRLTDRFHGGRRDGFMKERWANEAILKLVDPTDGKFDYPVKGRPNRTNIRAMRAAEESLDQLWKELDAFAKLKTGRILPELLDRDITRGRTIRRTPPWVDPPKAKKDSKAPLPSLYKYTYQPFSLLDHDESTEITGTFDKLSVTEKSKSKTRGIPAAPAVEDDGIADQVAESDTHALRTVFTVDKRSQKVFRALFHSPLAGDTPGEVPWTDFLHVMVTVGFTAEKLHGSAWQFVPQDSALGRPIQFHEPHPSSKLPFAWARRFGRRLFRAYGWTGEMFALG
jgi:hypothetical protein